MRRTPTKYKPNRSRQEATDVLRGVWGHADFRDGQWPIVEAVLAGRDVLGVLPTGTGKSVCYQLPAVLGNGLTLVVTPLVALMRDQVESLERRGVRSALIDSSVPRREADQRLTDCRFGKYRLLYVAPERLRSSFFVERCRNLPIQTVAIDEAHCISEWGHSFRPAYLDIARAVSAMGRPPIVALTATATPAVCRDIEKYLLLDDPVRVTGGFDRPNIVWSVFVNKNKRHCTEKVVRRLEGSGVLYASTRRDAEAWATWLERIGVSAEAYHAGLPRDVRDARQERWMDGHSRVIVATSAFGMGIDKPDVRFVIHTNMPASLEAYYQEAGRGGRDGKRSSAVLLYNDGDEEVHEALAGKSFPHSSVVRRVYDTVCSMAAIPLGAEADGPFVLDADAVSRALSLDAATISGAVDFLARQGVLSVLDQQHEFDGHIRLNDPEALRRRAESGSATAVAGLSRWLLRNWNRLEERDGWIGIRVDRVSDVSGADPERVTSALEHVAQLGIIEWRPAHKGLRMTLNGARQSKLVFDDRSLGRGRRAAASRLKEMMGYVQSRTCRRERLLAYFGESGPVRCGRCDICLRHNSADTGGDRTRLAAAVIELVRSGTPRHAWRVDDEVDDQSLDNCIDWLIREGHIRTSPNLDGTFELTRSGARLPSD